MASASSHAMPRREASRNSVVKESKNGIRRRSYRKSAAGREADNLSLARKIIVDTAHPRHVLRMVGTWLFRIALAAAHQLAHYRKQAAINIYAEVMHGNSHAMKALRTPHLSKDNHVRKPDATILK